MKHCYIIIFKISLDGLESILNWSIHANNKIEALNDLLDECYNLDYTLIKFISITQKY